MLYWSTIYRAYRVLYDIMTLSLLSYGSYIFLIYQWFLFIHNISWNMQVGGYVVIYFDVVIVMYVSVWYALFVYILQGCLTGTRVTAWMFLLQLRHNERDGVWNHQPRDCLLNCLFKAQIKENVKVPRHWPLCGEFTGDRWIPRTKGQ